MYICFLQSRSTLRLKLQWWPIIVQFQPEFSESKLFIILLVMLLLPQHKQAMLPSLHPLLTQLLLLWSVLEEVGHSEQKVYPAQLILPNVFQFSFWNFDTNFYSLCNEKLWVVIVCYRKNLNPPSWQSLKHYAPEASSRDPSPLAVSVKVREISSPAVDLMFNSFFFHLCQFDIHRRGKANLVFGRRNPFRLNKD